MQWESWGRYPRHKQQGVALEKDRFQKSKPNFSSFDLKSILPFGNGRSYGDSCLNRDGIVFGTRNWDRFLSWDRNTGVLRCESGVLFEEVLHLCVPQGWFLPVTPGTKLITVGGAIANDVHGKNHHCDGNFGHHLLKFELLRSDGSRFLCSKTENAGMFYATIGGLGLTGLITWAEFQMKPISNPWIWQEVIKMNGLEDFFKLSLESEKDFPYSVSWIDCLAKGKNIGKGLFIRGNHASPQLDCSEKWKPLFQSGRIRIPFDFPNGSLNPLTLKAFNFAYGNKQRSNKKESLVHFDPFFYPLDAILGWNKIYGSRGFLQYQCVVPYDDGGKAIAEILEKIASQKMGSFLAVLKTFGSIPSLGMLSFPRKGVTLALDFPNSGERLLKLLNELDDIVVKVNGAIYPGKDARMSGPSFQKFFPRWREFERQFKDPKFSSSLWRRVTT